MKVFNILSLSIVMFFLVNGLVLGQGNWEDNQSFPKTWTSGSVDIGTSNPIEKLQIGGNKGATFHDGGSKALSWNADYVSGVGWKYIGNDFATQIYTDYHNNKLYIRASAPHNENVSIYV